MLLNSKNLSEIKFNKKRIKLEKADAEIFVTLISGALVAELKKAKEQNSDDYQSLGIKVLMQSVVDEQNNPVFATRESFEELPFALQQEITNAVLSYNGLSDDAIKELEKNLSKTQSESSISD